MIRKKINYNYKSPMRFILKEMHIDFKYTKFIFHVFSFVHVHIYICYQNPTHLEMLKVSNKCALAF